MRIFGNGPQTSRTRSPQSVNVKDQLLSRQSDLSDRPQLVQVCQQLLNDASLLVGECVTFGFDIPRSEETVSDAVN